MSAYAKSIAEHMDGYFEDRGVFWSDEVVLEDREQSGVVRDLDSGAIDIEEFKRRTGKWSISMLFAENRCEPRMRLPH